MSKVKCVEQADPITKFKQRLGFNMSAIPRPTRTFEIGEEVQYGGHTNPVIVSTHDDGMIYCVGITGKNGVSSTQFTLWYEIFPNDDVKDVITFARVPSQTTRDLSSIEHMMLDGGLVVDPDYQREYLWEGDQQYTDDLIDSILEGVDIGSILLVSNAGYNHTNSTETKEYRTIDGRMITVNKCDDYTYSIVDGQQRITTIMRFVLGYTHYRGVYFHEWSVKSRYRFYNYTVGMRILDEATITKKGLIDLFLRVNRGAPQNKEHIDALKTKMESM